MKAAQQAPQGAAGRIHSAYVSRRRSSAPPQYTSAQISCCQVASQLIASIRLVTRQERESLSSPSRHIADPARHQCFHIRRPPLLQGLSPSRRKDLERRLPQEEEQLEPPVGEIAAV